MDIQINLLSFVHGIANTVKPDENLIKILTVGFNIDYPTLESEMSTITQQAYNGLNKEAGDWCKELMKSLLDIKYSQQ